MKQQHLQPGTGLPVHQDSGTGSQELSPLAGVTKGMESHNGGSAWLVAKPVVPIDPEEMRADSARPALPRPIGIVGNRTHGQRLFLNIDPLQIPELFYESRGFRR
jgi:molybdopterin-guanine dinucleotide biosynthesis protein A